MKVNKKSGDGKKITRWKKKKGEYEMRLKETKESIAIVMAIVASTNPQRTPCSFSRSLFLRFLPHTPSLDVMLRRMLDSTYFPS